MRTFVDIFEQVISSLPEGGMGWSFVDTGGGEVPIDDIAKAMTQRASLLAENCRRRHITEPLSNYVLSDKGRKAVFDDCLEVFLESRDDKQPRVFHTDIPGAHFTNQDNEKIDPIQEASVFQKYYRTTVDPIYKAEVEKRNIALAKAEAIKEVEKLESLLQQARQHVEKVNDPVKAHWFLEWPTCMTRTRVGDFNDCGLHIW